MLKKFFISLIFVFMISNSAFSDAQYVSALENKLFGTTYANENYSSRVDRIEREIYGKNYTGNSEERLEKIYKIYPIEEILGGTSYNNFNNYSDEYNPQYSENNDYPVITMIEEKTLHKSYTNEDIYKRLDRLEQKIYGKIQSDLSLNERVENLKNYAKIAKTKNNFYDETSYYSNSNNYDNIYNHQHDRISTILQEMELETFSQDFAYDTQENRLNRLEKFYFGAYQENLSEKQRLTKLAKIISKNNNYTRYNSYSDMSKLERNAQWAELIMNLLIIGLGFIL